MHESVLVLPIRSTARHPIGTDGSCAMTMSMLLTLQKIDNILLSNRQKKTYCEYIFHNIHMHVCQYGMYNNKLTECRCPHTSLNLKMKEKTNKYYPYEQKKCIKFQSNQPTFRIFPFCSRYFICAFIKRKKNVLTAMDAYQLCCCLFTCAVMYFQKNI